MAGPAPATVFPPAIGLASTWNPELVGAVAAAVGDEVIGCAAHRALALEAARQSIVLLKNQDNTLPLAADQVWRVAIVGPLSDQVHEDWYSGTMPYSVTVR